MNKRSKTRGCVVWVAGLVVLGVIAIVVGGLWTTEGFREAARTGRRLDERFAGAAPFVPAPDGAVPAERMERFLAVKADLQPFCPKFTEFYASLHRPLSPDELDRQTVVHHAFARGRAAWRGAGIMRRVGRLIRTRNEALAREGVQLDEFAYVYVVSYYAYLGLEPLFRRAGNERGRLGPGQRERIVAVLERQRERIREALPEGASAESLATIEDEIARLSEDPLRLPFEDGLSPAVAESIRPFAEPLARSWCDATDPLELRVVQRNGLGFRIY
jgi:hypothetical protein